MPKFGQEYIILATPKFGNTEVVGKPHNTATGANIAAAALQVEHPDTVYTVHPAPSKEQLAAMMGTADFKVDDNGPVFTKLHGGNTVEVNGPTASRIREEMRNAAHHAVTRAPLQPHQLAEEVRKIGRDMAGVEFTASPDGRRVFMRCFAKLEGIAERIMDMRT